MRRREPFGANQTYYITNKSIDGLKIFKKREFIERFLQVLQYYNKAQRPIRFSYARSPSPEHALLLKPQRGAILKYIAYCILPDRYILLVKLRDAPNVSKYIGDVENSFSRFFNASSRRKGPLWQSRFYARQVKTREQTLLLTRYMHLLPVTRGVAGSVGRWPYSSYRAYVRSNVLRRVLTEIPIRDAKKYEAFVREKKGYQIQLRKIKHLLLE